MAGLAQIEAEAAERHLSVLGTLPGDSDADLPPGTGTLVLLGPASQGFWDAVGAAPEFADGAPDPLDRWSRRVIGTWACARGAKALFPFGGPPWRPFQRWAVASGRAWVSPVGMLIHDSQGLMISYRGALALPEPLEALAQPAPAAPPCDTCPKPCLTACPVGAIAPAQAYDVPACVAHLRGPRGSDCREGGCLVRRSCPLSAGAGRSPAQSAFHMAAFLGAR